MKNFNNGQESHTPNSSLHFHYSREERLARKINSLEIDSPHAEVSKKRKKKMSLILTVFDIVIVLLIFGVYKFFWSDNVNKDSYEGMNFQTQAVLFESDILMSLDVIAKKESSIFSKDFEVEFLLTSAEKVIFKESLKGILPAKLKDIKSYSKKYKMSTELKNQNLSGQKITFKSSLKFKNKTITFKKEI